MSQLAKYANDKKSTSFILDNCNLATSCSCSLLKLFKLFTHEFISRKSWKVYEACAGQKLSVRQKVQSQTSNFTKTFSTYSWPEKMRRENDCWRKFIRLRKSEIVVGKWSLKICVWENIQTKTPRERIFEESFDWEKFVSWKLPQTSHAQKCLRVKLSELSISRSDKLLIVCRVKIFRARQSWESTP